MPPPDVAGEGPGEPGRPFEPVPLDAEAVGRGVVEPGVAGDLLEAIERLGEIVLGPRSSSFGYRP